MARRTPSGDLSVVSTTSRSRQRGYTMVVLVVAITVINIAVAAVLPVWSTAMQREREEELIFRGLQYAEAIRVFQRRFGRLPVRLEELLEAEPRSIRQLWPDPISGERNWGVIVNLAGRPGGGGLTVGSDGRPIPAGTPTDTGLPPSSGGGGAPTTIGPISGVYSREKGTALRVFLDQTTYDQWKFDVQLLLNPVGGNPAAGSGTPRLNAQWIGRPFRIPLPGGPGGAPGGGRPGAGPGETPPIVGGDPTGGKE